MNTMEKSSEFMSSDNDEWVDLINNVWTKTSGDTNND